VEVAGPSEVVAARRDIRYSAASVIAPDRRLSIFSLKSIAVDPQGWTDRTVVSSFGVSVGLSTDDPLLLTALCQRLPPCSAIKPSGPVDLQYSMYSRPTGGDGSRVQSLYVGHSSAGLFVQTLDRAKACEAFESTVQGDVAAASTEWVFIRAGVVVHDGAAIVIPAPTMHGTSSLVEALVRAGATYYSDEFAAIDAGGRVHPYRIPLSLRTAEGKRRVAVTDGSPELPPVPIRTIVSTRHQAGAAWQPRRGTPAEAVMALLANAIRVRLAPRVTLDVLARAADGAVLLEGPRGDADHVAPLLLERSP
jgi:hypothetical protein